MQSPKVGLQHLTLLKASDFIAFVPIKENNFIDTYPFFRGIQIMKSASI
jgi:hypothetical protein